MSFILIFAKWYGEIWRIHLRYLLIHLRYAVIHIYLLLYMGFINIYSFFVLLLLFGHLEYTLIYNLSLILILAFCGYIIGTAPPGSYWQHSKRAEFALFTPFSSDSRDHFCGRWYPALPYYKYIVSTIGDGWLSSPSKMVSRVARKWREKREIRTLGMLSNATTRRRSNNVTTKRQY